MKREVAVLAGFVLAFSAFSAFSAFPAMAQMQDADPALVTRFSEKEWVIYKVEAKDGVTLGAFKSDATHVSAVVPMTLSENRLMFAGMCRRYAMDFRFEGNRIVFGEAFGSLSGDECAEPDVVAALISGMSGRVAQVRFAHMPGSDSPQMILSVPDGITVTAYQEPTINREGTPTVAYYQFGPDLVPCPVDPLSPRIELPSEGGKPKQVEMCIAVRSASLNEESASWRLSEPLDWMPRIRGYSPLPGGRSLVRTLAWPTGYVEHHAPQAILTLDMTVEQDLSADAKPEWRNPSHTWIP